MFLPPFDEMESFDETESVELAGPPTSSEQTFTTPGLCDVSLGLKFVVTCPTLLRA